MDVLAPDVVLVSDGGGLVAAARRPITGADKVVAFLARVAQLADLLATTVWLNGMPGIRFDVGGEVTAVSLVIQDGPDHTDLRHPQSEQVGMAGTGIPTAALTVQTTHGGRRNSRERPSS